MIKHLRQCSCFLLKQTTFNKSTVNLFYLNQFKTFSTTKILFKKENNSQKKKGKAASTLNLISNDLFLKNTAFDMEKIMKTLNEEFNRHFSLKTDLRVYEDCKVIMPNGETHKMNHLGRILMKNPEQIIINFDENPSAIKPAKTALIKSALCSNPQQEGVTLYIPVKKATRELREQIVVNSKQILNDYKEALNKSFRKYSSENELNNNENEKMRRKKSLLELKKLYDANGETLMKEKQSNLMKEIT